MSRTLFIGDSHSTGYYQSDTGLEWWTDANYAEIWAKENDKDIVIYAQPGACNKKYPVWIRATLERYKDIDEVFVQSTYWNRYLLACSRKLDVGDGIKANHFSYGPNPPPATNDENIHRWSDERVTENYVEIVEQCRSELFEEFKGFQYDELNTTSQWGPFHEKYPYTKLWHESATHLQYREYCTDVYAMDNMCNDYGVDWYLWSINDRVYMPEHLDFFGPLKRCHPVDISAQAWLKENHNFDIETETNDGEHYPKSTHELIAKKFIPFVKTC